tara:strand:- start:620 stop:2500 length:1881 start_codon:yes stop_codon:yes gene_type:complete
MAEIKSKALINRNSVNKILFKKFIKPRLITGNNTERSARAKKDLKEFVALFKKTYGRAPSPLEINNIAKIDRAAVAKYLTKGTDYLSPEETRKITNAEPSLRKTKLDTELSKPVNKLTYTSIDNKKQIIPRFTSKAEEAEYKRLIKEKYSKVKGQSKIDTEYLAKKFLKTDNPTKTQLSSIRTINGAIAKELKLKYPTQTYEGQAAVNKKNREKRTKNINEVSSPSKEAKIRDLKKGSPLDLAHRSSLAQNKNLGLKYLISDLGFDPSKINQEIIIPTEQKLESLYKKQKFLVNKAQKFHLDKNKKIPLTLQKALEDINKQITDAAYSTDGRLNGIVVDEKTLKPGKVGIDYSKVPGIGLIENKAVKDLTKADMDLIKLNASSQIQNETKNLINLYEGAPQKIKNALETRIGCKSGCFVKTLNENPQKVTQQLKSLLSAPEVLPIKAPPLPAIRYNNITGAMVNTSNGTAIKPGELKTFAADNPISVEAGTEDAFKPIKKNFLKTVGKTLAKVGAPLPTALLDSYFIGKQIQDDKPAAEIAKDPLNWLGLATMSTLTKVGGVTGSGTANSILRLGMNPGLIRGISRFAGIPGLAISTALTAYDQYDKYKNEEGLIYNLFNDKAKAV